MFYFSKSKYCDFNQCPKIPWLKKFKPEEYVIDAGTQARFDAGNAVGDLAMGLFGDFVEVTSYRADGSLDLNKMKALTLQYIAEGKENICEASFDFEGLYCAVDILRKRGDGYDIYEVKSSASPENHVYIVDTSYQKYVLEKCGVKVGKVFIITIDTGYVFDGVLDLHKFFKISEVTALVDEEIGRVEDTLKEAEKIMRSKTEPAIDLSAACRDPYPCAFFGYCTKNLPSPSVFDLYYLGFEKKIALYKRGICSYEEVLKDGSELNDIRRRQVEYALEDRGTYIDKEGIKGFLQTLSYPLYFFDFETVQPVIPCYIGTRPYQQIPVQYSLHILHADGTLEHREFLGRSEEDPRRALAERLVKDIPADVCVLAYNKKFECARIKELAEAFPDLSGHLLKIRDNFKDLLDPFQKGFYYNRDMGGSFSIKSVLPAIYPGDPELDYHNLNGVHNGSEAMELFPRLKDMPKAEREQAENDLLKYCALDTFGLVKIYEELKRVS